MTVTNVMVHPRSTIYWFHVSIKRVQRLMKKANIRSITVKKFRPTPGKEKIVERENILDRDFSTKTINEKWGGGHDSLSWQSQNIFK